MQVGELKHLVLTSLADLSEVLGLLEFWCVFCFFFSFLYHLTPPVSFCLFDPENLGRFLMGVGGEHSSVLDVTFEEIIDVMSNC